MWAKLSSSGMTYNYDLLVIGAGSAGLAAAKRAAKLGAKVAIIEQNQVGGVCVNRGCIPKKLTGYAAYFAPLFADAEKFGWSVEKVAFDWQAFVAARDQEIKRLHQVQHQGLTEAGAEFIAGSTTFVDAHTLEVDDRTLTADYILIAVGGQPILPDIPGIDLAITSDQMFHLQQLPAHLLVIGGGYIGVEFASILHDVGTKVTIVDRESHILSGFDDELRVRVQQGLTQRDIAVLCDTTVKAIKSVSKQLQVTLSQKTSEPCHVDMVLCAIGRTPNLEKLNLEKVGVDLQGKAIAVDQNSRTSQANIYAVGDCTNRLPLTPVARAEGQIFADTVFGQKSNSLDYDNVPSAVFSRPEAAGAGLTEAKARERYGEDAVECNTIEFHSLYQRLAQSAPPNWMKQVIHRQSNKVVGVHLVAEHAAEMIQGIALAIKQGVSQQGVEQMIGIHPTVAEEFFT